MKTSALVIWIILIVAGGIVSAQAPPPLTGFVDMHTHPVSQLGFGEQLFFGDNDGPIDIALGSCNCVHNFSLNPFESCSQQNLYRNQMVDSVDDANGINPAHAKVAPGYPNFAEWPKYNSILHQQMWIEWIRRAKNGGLRVMVALAVNNQTMADAAETGGVNDDLASMNKQLVRMKELFGRHSDFLEIAYTSADLRRIVSSGKLAVILGVEMDNIGNFYDPADHKGATFNPNPTDAEVRAEIDRLFAFGVRYIFPIHITNNAFGGTALYSSDFGIANKYNTGSTFVPEAVDSAGGITFQLEHPFRQLRQSILGNLFMAVTGPILPPQIMPDFAANYPNYAPAGVNKGHRNSVGLTTKGEMAISYMMKKGMLIDIDHMSERSATSALAMATLYNYPLNSGHDGFRSIPDASKLPNENGRTDLQVQQIYSLGGMMGLGHGGSSTTFLKNYRYGLALSGNQPLAIGTDVNGFFPLPGVPLPWESITYGGTLTRSVTGNKTWDFNIDGMAHYGLLPEFIASTERVGMTAAEKSTFFSSAERFAQMWEKADTSKANVDNPDDDGDGVADAADNCQFTSNPDQLDTDNDGQGNVCDADDDNDGDPDTADNCALTANPDQLDADNDGQGDVCDPDDDNDTVLDAADNCQFSANFDQADNDGDGQGNVCDADDDNDGVLDGADNCAFTSNPSQADNDGDSIGDACDPDDDNDGILDGTDNCQFTANPSQANSDGDTLGDACDPDPILQEPIANVTVSLPANSTATSMTVTFPTPTATDAGGPVTVTTSPVSGAVFPTGTTTVNVTATDGDGNTDTGSFTVTVLHNFFGFLQPVDPMPTLNVVNAGAAVPVKFSLSGNKGLNIFAAGYPTSSQNACDANEPGTVIEETISAGGSSLNYDPAADVYSYIWKTNKAWKGNCRILIVRLSDGTNHLAKFRFR
jgi:microsomal dipeptidase-like Zn-dependent dipeptidase